jgi:hypothetical protein
MPGIRKKSGTSRPAAAQLNLQGCPGFYEKTRANEFGNREDRKNPSYAKTSDLILLFIYQTITRLT